MNYGRNEVEREPSVTKILGIIENSAEPLETKELEVLLKKETRVKVLYRLHLLRGEGKVKGKPVGSGKGTWIWWKTIS